MRVDRLRFTVVSTLVMNRFLMILLLSAATLSMPSTEVEACDSGVYNNFFVMADTAERVLVVHATGFGEGTIVKALKGPASDPLPPIESNCDPRFTPGRDYLVFVRPGGGYYTDSSAFSLLGDQGEDWIKLAADWIATSDDKERSKILEGAIDRELAMPAVYGQWAMLHEIAKLPMPHPSIDRRREGLLRKELEKRQSAVRPVEEAWGWFRSAETASSIALIRASRTSRAAVVQTLAGKDRAGKEVLVQGDALIPGADYLVLVDKKGSSLGAAFLMASSAERELMDIIATWAKQGTKQGRKDELLRDFVSDTFAKRSAAHPLAYDAAMYLTSRKKLNHRTCQILRAHYLVPKDMAKAVKKTCRGE